MRSRRGGWRRLWRPFLHWAATAGLIVQSAGCTRPFYRKRADEEVSEILAQKDKYPDCKIENWWIYPDPRARFADSSDPDHPPKPPDDPETFDSAPNPQRPPKAGVVRMEGDGYLTLIAQWDQENRARRTKQVSEEGSIEPPIPEEQEVGPAPQPNGDLKGVAKRGPSSGQDSAQVKLVSYLPEYEQKAADPGPREDIIQEVKSRSLVDITDRPAYLLTLDQAAELAMFNSREYQDQREELYLAALPVTQERFSFMAQWFGAEQAIRQYTGANTPNGQQSSWNLNSGTGFAKALPTGALLLFSFANQTVFDFLNPKNTTSVTSLNLNAIQPLLRGGGEAVALESLTQAERNLLYQIRTFARFRRQLYAEIASSNGGSISGAVFQPIGVLSNNNPNPNTGLGASGITPGVITPVTTSITSPIVAPLSPGTLALQTAITPTPSGYLNTMLQKIQVYIDQENIDVLTTILLRFRGLLEGDVVGPLQVQSVEQQLLSGRATILADQTQYLGALDAFKLEIGVPEQLSIEMDDSELQPLMKQFRRSRAIIDNEQAAVRDASALIPAENAPRLRTELLRLFQKSAIVRGTPFAATIKERWLEWEKLSDADLISRLEFLDVPRLAASLAGLLATPFNRGPLLTTPALSIAKPENLRAEAKRLLDLQADLQKQDKHLSPEDQARLRAIGAALDLGNFERALRQYEKTYVVNGKPKPAPAAEAARLAFDRQRIRDFQNVISTWQKVLVEARDDQWVAVRAAWPDLPRCCVDGVDLIHDTMDRSQAAAAKHALENRLDLMIVRAQVVDAWRQIKVYANALLGIFNVQYQLTSNSPLGAAQPTNISGSGNAHQLILNAELPLVRIQERNNYRAALIAYQRQRRALQEAEDITVQVVYAELYNLRQYQNTYRLWQHQLELAYLTIDSSLESLQAPTAPPPPQGLPNTRTGADGPAALTQQLLAAQRSLPTAQNALLTIWINYLDQRLQLYRDLEMMPLDERGVWIDQIRDCDCGILTPLPAAGPLQPTPAGPALPPEPLPLPKDAK